MDDDDQLSRSPATMVGDLPATLATTHGKPLETLAGEGNRLAT